MFFELLHFQYKLCNFAKFTLFCFRIVLHHRFTSSWLIFLYTIYILIPAVAYLEMSYGGRDMDIFSNKKKYRDIIIYLIGISHNFSQDGMRNTELGDLIHIFPHKYATDFYNENE